MEISLVRAFGWSLHEIDETAIESLLPFIGRLSNTGSGKSNPKQVFCDEVDWL